MKRRNLILLIAATVTTAGCSKLKKLTGQTDNTVLPGQREDILPPDQHTAKAEEIAADPAVEPIEQAPSAGTKTSKKAKGEVCNPEVDLECAPADAGGNDGIFSDG